MVAATVAIAAPAFGAGRPDGRYRGTATDLTDRASEGKVGFRVARRGRLIKGFKATVTATCINPNAIGGIEVVEVPFALDKVAVSRSGRFSRRVTFTADPPSDARQTYALKGRLRNGRVRGTIVLERRCSDRVAFTAKRKGR